MQCRQKRKHAAAECVTTRLLEELTVAKARADIEKLVHLTPQTARVLKNGAETVVPAEQVQVGDMLRVLPGETVPVDGIITAGQTSINQAVMTGESLPVDKTVGDEVSSGTVNQFGAFEMRAAKVGEDSSIQRMIRLVQSADAGKAIVRCCKKGPGRRADGGAGLPHDPGPGRGRHRGGCAAAGRQPGAVQIRGR